MTLPSESRDQVANLIAGQLKYLFNYLISTGPLAWIRTRIERIKSPPCYTIDTTKGLVEPEGIEPSTATVQA